MAPPLLNPGHQLLFCACLGHHDSARAATHRTACQEHCRHRGSFGRAATLARRGPSPSGSRNPG